MAKPILTATRLREFLQYDPKTGIITRTVKAGRRWHAGMPVGCRQKAGYLVTSVDGSLHYLHRLAWILQTGNTPNGQIDHINGVRDDNRWVNLRDVTNQENAQNQRRPKTDGTTGYLGVCWSPRDQKYFAKINVDGCQKHLGYFSDAKEAHQKYLEAKRRLHPTCSI